MKNLAKKPSELKRKERFNMRPMSLRDKLRWRLPVKNKNSEDSNMKLVFNKKGTREK